MSSFFRVSNLSKSFAGVPAVADISFSIEQGAIVGFVGPNGSGKSTTVDCLTGFQSVDEGSWSLEGTPLSGLPRNIIARNGLSRTFQAVQAYEQLSVLENLLVARQEFESVGFFNSILRTAKLRHSENDLLERAAELLDVVGLTHLSEYRVEFLSYGQRKLLSMAGAMISRPKIVFLDEPVAGVNPTMVVRITELLRKFNKLGITLVIIDHNMEFIMDICKRVIVVEAGSIIADGDPSLIRTDPKVLECYLGEDVPEGAN
ncbi:MAG: ABC transporter ATP-binding protein [Albidovulum sp.]|nr:ABC transporter ATP-binding protein [Albidovulum sp.]